MLHICNNICAIYTTTPTKPLMCGLWPSGRGDGREPNWHGFKPSSWRIDSSYWLLARWRASSFYRQQGTAPWMIDMSQHPWRGTVLATATAVARQGGRSRAQMKALNLLCRSAARIWCQGGIKAFRLATLLATAQIRGIRAVADKMVAKTTF